MKENREEKLKTVFLANGVFSKGIVQASVLIKIQK